MGTDEAGLAFKPTIEPADLPEPQPRRSKQQAIEWSRSIRKDPNLVESSSSINELIERHPEMLALQKRREDFLENISHKRKTRRTEATEMLARAKALRREAARLEVRAAQLKEELPYQPQLTKLSREEAGMRRRLFSELSRSLAREVMEQFYNTKRTDK